MMQMPERIFHLADIEPKKFDAITYFEKHPGKDLLYDIPTKLKTKEMILQVLIKEPSNLDYEPFFVDPILKPKLTPRRLLDYELCLLACEKNGGNLTYVPDRYIDYEICKAAVSHRFRNFRKLCHAMARKEIVDADGEPILFGDILYGEDGRAWTVLAPSAKRWLFVSGTNVDGEPVKQLVMTRWLTRTPQKAEEK